ncbi:protoporphyrinogen oxidase isoform X2 [Xylocopa sonorina]|uniref:protoporphyrinogen oxidase isoform X2 n=1 Tax=Xylocopa sonorina TaxID=1818115 RepID=UPI00403A7D2E
MTAILGAGMSGLSAAYYALGTSKLAPLVVFEATNRVGGWVRSIKQPDGTIFEKGPRIIRISAQNILPLIEELDLSCKIIPIKMHHAAVKNRYVYADNALHSVPNSLKSIFTKNTLLNRSMISVLWKDFRAPKASKDDESVYSFVERRFGKDMAEKMAAPVFCGICGGDIHMLSAKSFMPKLVEFEQKHGSIFIVQRAKREVWRMWGLKGGFEQLPQALAENIAKRGVNIKMESNCEQIVFNKNSVELTVNGKVEEYSRIISGLPAKSLANLVQKQHPELSKELLGIPTVTIAVVNLQFSGNVLPVKAFGVLVPPKEEIPILGVTFDSCVLPQNSNRTVLTVMMGGAWFEKYFGECSSEEHLKTVATEYATKILQIHENPTASNVSILRNCIPQYTIGHAQRLNCIHDYISAHKIPLGLCGSSYRGLGVVDVILSAKEAVSNINLP